MEPSLIKGNSRAIKYLYQMTHYGSLIILLRLIET